MASLRDLAERIKAYFNPTSTVGQNFWSTPVAQRLGQAQQITEPILKTVQTINQYNPYARIVEPIEMGLAKQIGRPLVNYGKFIGAGLIQQPILAATKGKINVPFYSPQEFEKVATPKQAAREGVKNITGAALSATSLFSPTAIAYRAFPAIYGIGSKQGIGKSIEEFAGPSRLIETLTKSPGFEETKVGKAIDTAELLIGLVLNRGIDDMVITAIKNRFGASSRLTKLMEKAPAMGLTDVSPNVFKIHPEDQDVMERFYDAVKFKGKSKQPLGDLGRSAQDIAEHYFGAKWRNVSNKKLADAFAWALDVNRNIPLVSRGKLPKLGIMGFTEGPVGREGQAISKLGLGVGQEVPTKIVSSDFTKVENKPRLGMQSEIELQKAKVLPDLSAPPKSLPESQIGQIERKPSLQDQQALNDIIAQGNKQIGSATEQGGKSLRQMFSDFYTQWIDRYNPIVQASRKAKETLKIKGAELRPEYDPEYLVRRLTGAGGIADYRFQTELNPIIKSIDQAGIPKLDLDTYLANKRIAGFGEIGRKIKGADPEQARQIVTAIEAKYPQIGQIAQSLYDYQNKGFQEMIDAGFLSEDTAKLIRQQNPDYSPLKRVMDEVNDYLGLPTRKTMQGTQPIFKIKGSERKIESPLESIIGNTFSQRAAIEKNRVARSIVGLQNIAPELGFKKVGSAGSDTITVWQNGKKEYWRVGSEIAEVAKGVNEEAMNLVLKIIKAPASILRQGATGRNPEFMIPNVVRDQLDAGISSKYGYIPFVDYVSGLWSMLTNDEVYQKWQKSGAKIDLGELSGKKSIKAMFDEKTSKKNLFSWLSSGLNILGRYSEQPTRVGLFKKAYEKTGNELLAAVESRDATVDFARMGSKMKVANSIIPFLNVGVQGFDKLIRAVKDNPFRVLITAGIYGVLPQITSTIYNLQNFPEEYKEIPQYEKDSNFVLVKGRNSKGTVDYITIPKGNIVPIVANPVQSFLDYLYKTDSQSFYNMAMNVMSDTLPILGQGSSLKEIGLKTIGGNLPQAIKPITENLINKSFWKYNPNKEQAKEIVPSYLQARPAYLQKYAFTPKMYQTIGAVLNVSPLQVQNLMEGYLAGYVKIPAQIIDMLYQSSRNEPVNPNNKTILRRFIKETYPSSGYQPVQKPPGPGLIERITSQVEAAGKGTAMSPAMEKYAIEDKKYEMRSKKLKTAEVNGKVLYTKENGDIRVIDPAFQPTPPKITGLTELDKKSISRFNGEITQKANDIYDLYRAGKISVEEADRQLTDLKGLKEKYAAPKKAKKPAKITIRKVSVPKTNIKIKKAGALKLKKAPVTKVTKIKPKSIKIATTKYKLPKAKKIKGLTKGIKIV